MQEFGVFLGSFGGAGVLVLFALWRINSAVAIENECRRSASS